MTGQLFAHYFLTDAGAPRSAPERDSGATTALAVR